MKASGQVEEAEQMDQGDTNKNLACDLLHGRGFVPFLSGEN